MKRLMISLMLLVAAPMVAGPAVQNQRKQKKQDNKNKKKNQGVVRKKSSQAPAVETLAHTPEVVESDISTVATAVQTEETAVEEGTLLPLNSPADFQNVFEHDKAAENNTQENRMVVYQGNERPEPTNSPFMIGDMLVVNAILHECLKKVTPVQLVQWNKRHIEQLRLTYEQQHPITATADMSRLADVPENGTRIQSKYGINADDAQSAPGWSYKKHALVWSGVSVACAAAAGIVYKCLSYLKADKDSDATVWQRLKAGVQKDAQAVANTMTSAKDASVKFAKETSDKVRAKARAAANAVSNYYKSFTKAA